MRRHQFEELCRRLERPNEPPRDPSSEKRTYLLGRPAVISLRSGNGIRGIIFDHLEDVYVVKRAEVLTPTLPPAPADGEIVVDLSAIEFVQLLPYALDQLPPPPNAGG